MATTVANVPVGGRPYQIGAGSLKETITDVTIADNSEVVTAEQLGLQAVFSARAVIQDASTSDTGVYATAAISAGSNSVTVAVFGIEGAAATTAATTVIRVYAAGY